MWFKVSVEMQGEMDEGEGLGFAGVEGGLGENWQSWDIIVCNW